MDIDAMTDLKTPWCVHSLATVGVVDAIGDDGADVTELAAATGCDPKVLALLLRHLAGFGAFSEIAPGRFVVTEEGRELFDPAGFLDLNGIGGRFAYAWGTLPTLLRTGRPGYADLFGKPFWEDLAAHPDIAASFDALMGPAGHGRPSADFAVPGGWDRVRSVVDVGGGTGAMLVEILRAHPSVHGTLLDLPDTVRRADFTDTGVADRITVVGQSFFDPLPAGADVYLLRKILNDWNAEDTVALLRRCADAARPAGCVVILGGVHPDALNDDLAVDKVLLGGESNSVTEFRELARQAGLDVVETGRSRGGYFGVGCRPR